MVRRAGGRQAVRVTISARREPTPTDPAPTRPVDADLPPVVARTDSPRTTWRPPAAPRA
ncbi:hypothetical protein GCM10027047_15520 [Rhodococcus aerolatus]